MCWRIFVRFSRAKLIGCKQFILKNNFKKYIKNHKKLKISTTTLFHPKTLRKITEKRLRHVNSKRSLQLTDFLRSRQTAAKTFLQSLLHRLIRLRSQKISVRETESLEFLLPVRIASDSSPKHNLRAMGKRKTRSRAILTHFGGQRRAAEGKLPRSSPFSNSANRSQNSPYGRSVRFDRRWASGRLRFVRLSESFCIAHAKRRGKPILTFQTCKRVHAEPTIYIYESLRVLYI